jgi:hypothetical protein
VQIGEKNYRTAFILGAGATRGAVKHVLVNNKRLKPPLNADFFQVARTYARAVGANSATARRLSRLEAVFKEEIPFKGLPTMEEAFSLLYTAKDFPEIYKTGPGRKPVAGYRKEIEDFLGLTFDILVTLDRGATTLNGYDRLVSKLGTGDTLISLNYDTLLDSALVRAGWDPKLGYKLVGGKGKVEWERALTTTNNSARLSDISLLKLHGSANWFVRGSYSNLTKIFETKPVRVTSPRKNDIARHLRQIVPPIYGKLFGHSHWRKLWKDAYKALCDAEVVVVIGCSLIDTDFHLRALVGRVTKHRKQNAERLKRLIVVADIKARRKWFGVFKAAYKKGDGYKFLENFLTGGLKA